MIQREITERRSKCDTFLGLKCSSPSQESYVETETTICDVCGSKRVFVTEVTELLHIPSIRQEVINRTGPSMNEHEWGYKKTRFYACASHTENELDQYVMGQKSLVKP